MTPDWQPLKSSHIAAARYDDATGELHVRFHDESEHAFSSVPRAEYEALLSAPSAGRHFHQNIKGQYRGRAL